jgi:hypothetical protein
MTQPIIATQHAIRTPRAAAVAGIVFSVLMTAATVLVRVAVPDDSDDPGTWVLDSGKRRAVTVALNLIPFAGIAFLWFIGVIRARLGAGEDRFFATVFLGSGLLYVGLTFVAGALAGALLVAPDSAVTAPTPELWAFSRRTAYSLVEVYAMRMAAVFTLSTTTLGVRLQILPRSLSILGYAVAVILLIIAGMAPWLELIFPIWVFIISLYILVVTLRRRPEQAAGAAT